MKHIALFLGLCVIALFLGLCESANAQNGAAPPPPAYTGTAVAPVNPSYQTYTVSNVKAFQLLWLPLPAKSLIFWNGLMITPSFDWKNGGFTFNLAADPLTVGDRITVVTFQ